MRSDGSSGNDAVNVLSFRRLGTQKPHARNFERIEPPEGPKRLRQGSGVCLQSTAHRLMAGDSMDARCRLGRLGSLRGFLPLADASTQMTSLGSLREEDLDEICIDSPTNNCTHLARRSYSQPEIHFSLNSSSISPDEWDKTPPNPEPFFGESCRPLKQYCSSHHQSTLSDGTPYSPVQRTKSFNLPRYDPSPVEERVKSMQSLLASIYQDDPSQNRYLPDSLTESFQSDASHASPRRLTVETLQSFGRKRLVSETRFLLLEIEKANQRLVKVVRQRSYYRAKQATKCAILSAILMANSSKTSADSKLRFSLEPPSLHEGVEEWKRAMRAMARVPGGLPSLVRCKLWSTLGELYMQSSGFDWEEIRSKAFSEKLRPDDSKIHSQILKDLHRTGWSEFDDEKKLKQVLLAYARERDLCAGLVFLDETARKWCVNDLTLGEIYALR
ncbi:unnamed protein product [Heligmosomoides polygyrus]|uniref:Rab-GAP TBC domain-containing protein n=1 Tax=Heligmosomoides polygyrus TaxID=6339 RepID=A0A3P8E972_HELPZ|nr:unnamed protein product [Heligmosomoides polygyrus]